VPAKVSITFQLAKNATLYAPDGRKVAEGGRKGKEVVIELDGSTAALEYKASFGKSKELVAVTVFPDRDGTIDVSPEAASGPAGGGRSPTVRAGSGVTPSPGAPSPGADPGPTTTAGTPTTSPGSPGATPVPSPPPTPVPDPEEEDITGDPVLKGFDKDKEPAKEPAKDLPSAPSAP
jgi:hypothetical protein